ncbi:hypothetical protein DFH09DRAFT_1327009 [Mycena vulgaris]|nr:hypothetical protein DFH09DRAFT_1327009 [Mycena vulgaris]
MDSDTEPLIKVDASEAENASRSSPQHFCARCSSELESHQDHKESKPWTPRHILIIVAMVLSTLIFTFSVAEMATAHRFESPSILQVFVALWTDVTVTFLGLLLYMGRRRESRRKLGRTDVQIKVMSALAFSWIIFMVAMMTQNREACHHNLWRPTSETCGFFTTVHILSWFLIIVLFGAAYATYRRAITIHGNRMVPLPAPLVPAWRLSDIADGEGAIKI